MAGWKFRVVGPLRWGPGAALWHWEDAPKPPPVWVRHKRVEDQWRPHRDGKAAARRLETAGSCYTNLRLDSDKTQITHVRLDLIGTVEADSIDAAVTTVLAAARWTLISVYGWPLPASSKLLELPPLDVRVQPINPGRRR